MNFCLLGKKENKETGDSYVGLEESVLGFRAANVGFGAADVGFGGKFCK